MTEVKTFSEIFPKMEGDYLKLAEIKEEFVITKAERRKTQFGDAYFVQCTNKAGDYKFYFITSSNVLMVQIEEIKPVLPVLCRLERKTSKAGRQYWTLE